MNRTYRLTLDEYANELKKANESQYKLLTHSAQVSTKDVIITVNQEGN